MLSPKRLLLCFKLEDRSVDITNQRSLNPQKKAQ